MNSITSITLAISLIASPIVLAQEDTTPSAAPSTTETPADGSTETTLDQITETPFDRSTEALFDSGPGPVSPATGASFGEPLAGTSQIGGAPIFGGVPLDSEALFRWGRLNLHPYFSYQVSYGSGISRRVGEQSSSWIHRFSPGILINLGEHWSLNYTPTLRWYSDERFTDGLDHRVSLTGRTTLREWNLGLSQTFSRTTDPLIETGSETDQDTYGTSVRANRALNSKVSIDLGVSQSLRFVDTDSGSRRLTNRKSWSTMNWIDYKYQERLSLGFGAGFTYDDVQLGSDMTSQQVQARLRWLPGDKLSLGLSGGLDIRQYLDADISGTVSPIFSATAGYQLFETTSLFASLSRTVSPSYYSQTLSESTGLSAGVNQRLLSRFFLNVRGGYTIRDYSVTSRDGGRSDEQETYSFGASLGTGFLKRGSVSIFYNKSWTDYGVQGQNYNPQTVGAQISYRF
jgi:hypothetical protein